MVNRTLKLAGLLLGMGVVLGVAVVGSCGWAGKTMLEGILLNQPNSFVKGYGVVKWCGGGVDLIAQLPELLGDKTYLVLLQNNTELRPTGGFMGSYARITFKDGGLVGWKVEDIYQPDGQLAGHVEPPYPVQEAFRQGWWRLRDANWDPDFASSAATVAWFFEQGKEKTDGIVAVNLDLMKKWVGVLGEVKSVTYDETITENNLYGLAQKHAEIDWKPGSTQKRDFLGAVGVAVWEETKHAPVQKIAQLAKLVWGELKSGQITIWMKDPQAQQLVKDRGWSGELQRVEDDYLYVVEANLGANKANCCVEREVTQTVVTEGKLAEELVEVRWKNGNVFQHPKPPVFWGGHYLNYVRILIPRQAVVEEVKVGDRVLRKAGGEEFAIPNSMRQELSEDIYVDEVRDDKRVLGMWVKVPGEGAETIKVKYSWLRGERKEYGVMVERQPGIRDFGYRLILNGQIVVDERIDMDRVFVR